MAYNGMSSSEYERVTSEIAQELYHIVHADRKHLSAKHGSTNRVAGISGYRHQIDASIGDKDFLFIVECKCWATAIPTIAVLTFASRFRDIQDKRPTCAIEAAIVTTVGAHSGAHRLAKHFGIRICVLRSPTDFSIQYRDYGRASMGDNATASDQMRFVPLCNVCLEPMKSDGERFNCPEGHGWMALGGGDFHYNLGFEPSA